MFSYRILESVSGFNPRRREIPIKPQEAVAMMISSSKTPQSERIGIGRTVFMMEWLYGACIFVLGLDENLKSVLLGKYLAGEGFLE